MTQTRPALETIVQLAVSSTGCAHGWLLVVDEASLQVAAAAGGSKPGTIVGRSLPPNGTAGYVVESGQPVALRVQSSEGQPTSDATALLGQPPASVLCVPCTYESEALGALELIDKTGDDAFSFDDVEIATLLGDVAGAVLAEGVTNARPASPEQLAAELRDLAATDPARYAAIATTVEALLGRS